MTRSLTILLILSISFLISSNSGYAGKTSPDSTLCQTEQELARWFSEALEQPFDSLTLEAGEHFFEQFRRLLENPDAFSHPFDSLKLITDLVTPDESSRIFTWNLPLKSGSYRYYGIMVIKDGSTSTVKVIGLNDCSEQIEQPEETILSPENWFGAIYYQIISQKMPSGDITYTLLGWHGDNRLLSSRVIEVVTISPDLSIRFGANVFCDYKDDPVTRVIFRYSSRASMLLRYEEQQVVLSKTWDPKSRSFRTKSQKTFLIVCDRLSPPDPQLEGQYEYYMPAGDLMDGFLFREGCWYFMKDIDVRNPKS